MKDMLTIRLKKKVVIKPGQPLYLKDISRLDSAREEIACKVKDLIIYDPQVQHGSFYVIDVMDVMDIIHKHFPALDVRHAGPPQTLVEISGNLRPPSIILVLMVMILLFIGSGLAIMNFHMDVSMPQVHERIYYLITGEHKSSPLIMQIPYSLGIGIGIFVFFNRLIKKRLKEEPSPLELEMFLYQENIEQYMIDHEKRKEDSGCHESVP
ncbi:MULTISPECIES: stage V sporulation protein AA [Thermoactinomyces]|jgi:stage V sporulation protein AA|uniref:Stage V sporulation protein AA n=1 Tax=Thermoactinomyces vulgaris TaxID=2026 RepID=A0ABS0QDU1_THEVU|nr:MULTISPECIES: stage V sporulation protein AA [Thermoactinomyces]KFZ39645.1 hypothetical protein JS81_12840 [Thermoactinomyces sp. Gus2-1]KYQ87792.1 hypothetical protein AYX07_03705 [Thermoactinomyces sp. AS95]MBA4550369.1 stage V sporulation protein AA [Thermoactinomyces vulgaris]MBA4595780.1 stage V sporulation protein AA [Thermoactinomyces vulgaris]MBH8582253.1 stage V sporulation protein AA [Thermoactinomyces sp. CICC 10735]